MMMKVPSEVVVEAEAAVVAAVDVVTLLETDLPQELTDVKEEVVNLPSSKTISLPYDRPNEILKASLRRSKKLGLTLGTLMRQ